MGMEITQVHGWMGGRVGEWINGWMARLCGWMGKWVDGWMDEEMDDRWMDGRVAEWINRWMAGLMDRCMDG